MQTIKIQHYLAYAVNLTVNNINKFISKELLFLSNTDRKRNSLETSVCSTNDSLLKICFLRTVV